MSKKKLKLSGLFSRGKPKSDPSKIVSVKGVSLTRTELEKILKKYPYPFDISSISADAPITTYEIDWNDPDDPRLVVTFSQGIKPK